MKGTEMRKKSKRKYEMKAGYLDMNIDEKW